MSESKNNTSATKDSFPNILVIDDEPLIRETLKEFLIQEGFLKRTSRGREATEKAYRHVGIEPKAQTGSLF